MRAQGHAEATGKAKITPAYNLPCKYVLHTVGPIVQGRLTQEHERLLASCYTSCLELAPEIAVETVREFLKKETSVKRVIFNVFKDSDWEIYERLLG